MEFKGPHGPGNRPSPALPPRQSRSSVRSLSPLPDDAPPPYEDIINNTTTNRDPRTSSQQSLRPSQEEEQDGRRKLLLIYIHGFMGNESSFRSFPAHVHNLLRVLLSETHIVHTKLYPRYRSKKHITVARDDFSRWLQPHEGPLVDVVLLGHSMGGLVAAEVVTMPPSAPTGRPLMHRIIGSINFDVPFLGMHPGIIKSGLASIFSPAKDTPGDQFVGDSTSNTPNVGSPERTDTLFQHSNSDPNFNPSFTNDVVLPVRQGWSNAWHFINKHSKDLKNATKQLVSSHMEFGGAMANYSELKARYARVRILEELSQDVRGSVFTGAKDVPRVRFINYYTASSGRPKKDAAKGDMSMPSSSTLNLPTDHRGSHSRQSSQSSLVRTPSPAITIEEYREDGQVERAAPGPASTGSVDWERAVESLSGVLKSEHISNEPGNRPMVGEAAPRSSTGSATQLTELEPMPLSSPASSIHDLPRPPTMPDTSHIDDPRVLKSIIHKHGEELKKYERSLREREKTLRKENKRERKGQLGCEKAASKMDRKEDKLTEKRQRMVEKLERAEKKSQRTRAKLLARVERLENKGKARELSHNESETLRLETERKRMEAEARRMRGEPPVAPSDTMSETTTSELILTPPSSPDLSPDLSSDDDMDDISLDRTESTASHPASSTTNEKSKVSKPPKDRKFCVLPPKDSNGVRDPCWVRIYMAGMDEVAAHCGLFFVDERYERMVGDVAEKIEGWVREAGDVRIAESMGM